jgi:hypothetical protein
VAQGAVQGEGQDNCTSSSRRSGRGGRGCRCGSRGISSRDLARGVGTVTRNSRHANGEHQRKHVVCSPLWFQHMLLALISYRCRWRPCGAHVIAALNEPASLTLQAGHGLVKPSACAAHEAVLRSAG